MTLKIDVPTYTPSPQSEPGCQLLWDTGEDFDTERLAGEITYSHRSLIPSSPKKLLPTADETWEPGLSHRARPWPTLFLGRCCLLGDCPDALKSLPASKSLFHNQFFTEPPACSFLTSSALILFSLKSLPSSMHLPGIRVKHLGMAAAGPLPSGITLSPRLWASVSWGKCCLPAPSLAAMLLCRTLIHLAP